jgi:hypothetical protein
MLVVQVAVNQGRYRQSSYGRGCSHQIRMRLGQGMAEVCRLQSMSVLARRAPEFEVNDRSVKCGSKQIVLICFGSPPGHYGLMIFNSPAELASP